jgi:hypothetical protein
MDEDLVQFKRFSMSILGSRASPNITKEEKYKGFCKTWKKDIKL